MTSEVVVMNNLAVALAADSAATVSAPGRENKVYNSADKLFMLSRKHPVGVMVFSNGALLGVPWETLLKRFRQELGDAELPNLHEYGEQLLIFLDNNSALFPGDAQTHYYLQALEDLYQGIADTVKSRLVGALTEPAERQREAINLAKAVVLKTLKNWPSQDDNNFSREVAATLATEQSGKISQLIVRTFDGLAPDNEVTKALQELAILMISKDYILPSTFSGVVVAGFGRDDFMPVMQYFQVGGVYKNRLKHRKRKVLKVDGITTPSVIETFAQSQMVKTFLHGINPVMEQRVLLEILQFISGLPSAILDRVPQLDVAQRGAIEPAIRADVLGAAAALLTKLRSERVKTYQAAHQAVANLSKGDLAHVAASLVNLNMFQKRMSTELETVGGPIDVAVISKGDGFVWIDRKHYFKPSLNPHFFSNHYSNIAQQEKPG